jgi:hypothetical protein
VFLSIDSYIYIYTRQRPRHRTQDRPGLSSEKASPSAFICNRQIYYIDLVISHRRDSTPRWAQRLTDRKLQKNLHLVFKGQTPFPYHFSTGCVYLCNVTFLPFPVHCPRLLLEKMITLELVFTSSSNWFSLYVHNVHSSILRGTTSYSRVQAALRGVHRTVGLLQKHFSFLQQKREQGENSLPC